MPFTPSESERKGKIPIESVKKLSMVEPKT